jgi:hypothetical protein
MRPRAASTCGRHQVRAEQTSPALENPVSIQGPANLPPRAAARCDSFSCSNSNAGPGRFRAPVAPPTRWIAYGDCISPSVLPSASFIEAISLPRG